MRPIVVYIAATLDGFIATRDDSLQWLFSVEGEGDNGYGEFIATVDTIVMGRRTYDWLLREVGEENFPYREQRCYVLSHTSQGQNEHVTFWNGDVLTLARQLRAQEGKRIWLVGGGELIQAFAQLQLVDEWILTLAPVLLGEGIPLFAQPGAPANLRLMGMRRFGQFAELHYETVHPAPDA